SPESAWVPASGDRSGTKSSPVRAPHARMHAARSDSTRRSQGVRAVLSGLLIELCTAIGIVAESAASVARRDDARMLGATLPGGCPSRAPSATTHWTPAP